MLSYYPAFTALPWREHLFWMAAKPHHSSLSPSSFAVSKKSEKSNKTWHEWVREHGLGWCGWSPDIETRASEMKKDKRFYPLPRVALESWIPRNVSNHGQKRGCFIPYGNFFNLNRINLYFHIDSGSWAREKLLLTVTCVTSVTFLAPFNCN